MKNVVTGPWLSARFALLLTTMVTACSSGAPSPGASVAGASGRDGVAGGGASGGTAGSGGATGLAGGAGAASAGSSGVAGGAGGGSGAAGTGAAGMSGAGGGAGAAGVSGGTAHVWELVEITLKAAGTYANPYTDVDVWVDLKGPGFAKKVWGFWDGQSASDPTFRVRVVATAPGAWTWTSASSQAKDAGLAGKTGAFTAVDWTEAEKLANPNRRGFVLASKSGHALSYADGTPFFLLADTEWSAFTYRVPLKGVTPPADFSVDVTKFSFEGEIQALKKLGFNSIAVISTSPNWNEDAYALTVNDTAGVPLRSAKPKSNTTVSRGMNDEQGNGPFSFPESARGSPTSARITIASTPPSFAR